MLLLLAAFTVERGREWNRTCGDHQKLKSVHISNGDE
jgi:hypothetical protein